MIAFGTIGTGGIKPCMAAFCDNQFSEEEKEKRDRVVGLFYLFINIGAIGSSFSTLYLKSISKDTYWLSLIVQMNT